MVSAPAILTPTQSAAVLSRCQDVPGAFLTDCLDVKPGSYWSKMREMEQAIDAHDRVSIRAGHGVSKTYTMARLALKFLYTRVPSTVITTAPTGAQVKDILWRELRRAHSHAKLPLGGKLTSLNLDLQAETDEDWFAKGFSTKADTITQEATAFQGYHNDHLFIIFDEAAGIPHEIWNATRHVGAPYKRWVAIGNPTSRVGDFAATFSDPSWHNMSIAVTDTPNFKAGKTLIAGMYGREYEEEIRRDFGVDSDEYRVRVLGELSNKAAQGSYYSVIINSLRKQGLVGGAEIRHDPTRQVYTVWDVGYTYAVWWFQRGAQGCRFLDYYEDQDTGVADVARVVKEKGIERNYNYGGHYAPADISNNSHRVTTGKTVLEIGRDIGLNFIPLQMERSVQEGIERTRRFLKDCSFAQNCAFGLNLLEQYHERLNKRMSTPDHLVFTGVADKDGTDHCADAMRYASLAFARLPGHSNRRDKSEIDRYRAMYGGAYAN